MLTSATVQALTPDQAQRGLVQFYLTLPAEVWAGKKPSISELETWLDEAQDFLPAEILTFIDGFQSTGGTMLQGEASKCLLRVFRERETLTLCVDHAVHRALQPGAAPAPTAVISLIAALTVLAQADPADRTRGRDTLLRWNANEATRRLASRMAGLVQALPRHALDAAIEPTPVSARPPIWIASSHPAPARTWTSA